MSRYSDAAALDRVRAMAREASALQREEDIMVSVAAGRLRAILVELLMEMSPREMQGAWQEVP